jgi:hypothetical protein
MTRLEIKQNPEICLSIQIVRLSGHYGLKFRYCFRRLIGLEVLISASRVFLRRDGLLCESACLSRNYQGKGDSERHSS